MPDRVRTNLVALLVLVAVATGVLLWQRPWADSAEPAPRATFGPESARALTEQIEAMSDATTRAEFVAAAGATDAARTFAEQAWDARELLDVRDVSLSHVRDGTVPDSADGSATAVVEVRWRLGDESPWGAATARRDLVRLRVSPAGDGVALEAATAADDAALPVWLAGEVAVHEIADARLVTVGGGKAATADRVATARRQVLDLVPGADGRLVVLEPGDAATAAGLLGRAASELDQIAGVATGLGGSGGPLTVVLNPAVFDTMDATAAQVVMTHEATHAMTRAVGQQAESWVIEGFADFVALHDDDRPLALTAGQALRQVRDDGPPAALPGDGEFANSTHGLGALYESTWLAFRMLGEQHGDDAVVGFYEAVLGGTPVDDALSRAFGLTRAELTTRWRDYLTKSASMVS